MKAELLQKSTGNWNWNWKIFHNWNHTGYNAPASSKCQFFLVH